MNLLLRILTTPTRIWKWAKHEKPYRWRPRAYVVKRWQWRFMFLPTFYMGWSADGLYDFDDVGIEWCFGPWTYRLVIADND
jgi:hypothetical protein